MTLDLSKYRLPNAPGAPQANASAIDLSKYKLPANAAPAPVPAGKPKIGDIGSGLFKAVTTPVAPAFPAKEGGVGTIFGNTARTLGNIPTDAAEIARSAVAPAVKLAGSIPGAVKDLAPLGGKGAIRSLGEGLKETAKGFAKGVDRTVSAIKNGNRLDQASSAAKTLIEHPLLVPSMLYGGEAAAGKNAIEKAAQVVTRGADTSVPALAAKTKDVAATIMNAGTKAAAPIGKAARAVGGTTKENLKYGLGQTYGFSKDTVDHILTNPAEFTPEKMAAASRHALGDEVHAALSKEAGNVPTRTDLGAAVKDALIRRKQELNEHAAKYVKGTGSTKAGDLRKLVTVEPNWLSEQLKHADVSGLSIGKDGKLAAGATSRINDVNSPGGVRRLQQLLDTWQPEFSKGKMSQANFLKFRQDLAAVANYQGGVDTTLNKVADSIRGNFNHAYRKQIRGLEKLDAEHTTMSRDFERLSKGLVVEDANGQLQLQDGALDRIANASKAGKDEVAARLDELAPGLTDKVEKMRKFEKDWQGILNPDGTLAENALNSIANATNAGRDLRLQRLNEIVPGIKDKIRFLKTVEDVQSAMGQKVATYGRAGAIAVGSANLWHSPWLLPLLWYATNPKNGVRLLRMISKAAKSGDVATVRKIIAENQPPKSLGAALKRPKSVASRPPIGFGDIPHEDLMAFRKGTNDPLKPSDEAPF